MGPDQRVRVELAGQGTLVAALVPGIVLPEGTMNDPADLVRLALDGLEAGQVEILDPTQVTG